MGFTAAALLEEAMRTSIVTYGGMGHSELRALPWREYEAATDLAARLGREANGE